MSDLKTVLEKALDRPVVYGKNEIPPIKDPMGRHWRQPNTELIVIDDTHALMPARVFEELPEYSGTFPTGVYPGKTWRRHDGLFDPRCKPEDRKWKLVWFGYSDRGEEWCSNNYRLIIVSDPENLKHPL